MGGTKAGLRERKKLRRRQAIVDVSTRLFLEQGFEQTTIAQIVEEVDIAMSTFFDYFASKVDVVFCRLDFVIASAQGRITERPEDETAMSAIADWLREELPRVEQPYAETIRRTQMIIASEPKLQAEQWLRLAPLEDVLAEAFARDLGDSADGIRARMLAVMALRAMVDAWAAWFDKHANEADFHLKEGLAANAAYTMQVLERGYELIAQLPGPPDGSRKRRARRGRKRARPSG